MAQYTQILRDLGPEPFAAVFGASSRRDRETCLHRHKVRSASGRSVVDPGQRARQKVQALRARLAAHDDEQMCQELLRTWLMGRRPMLAAALDHLGIAHQDGLTEADPAARIVDLDAAGEAALVAALAPHAQAWEIDSYLRFMGRVPTVGAGKASRGEAG